MVDYQCCGDTVAELPRLELAAVDVIVTHVSAKSYTSQAAKHSGVEGGEGRAYPADALQEGRASSSCIPVCDVCSVAVRVHREGGGFKKRGPETTLGTSLPTFCTSPRVGVCMYVCMYDYKVVSTRTLTPPTTGTD